MSHSKEATCTADLTDDLIIEILSRLPARSVCRFKCVSQHWYRLISDSEHRKKLPQTISGFFYTGYSFSSDGCTMFPHYEGISSDEEQIFYDPSLPFLTGYMMIRPEDGCNGLVLCRCLKKSSINRPDFVVCNPATKEWLVLPEPNSGNKVHTYRLGFDLAVSPHFHVFRIPYYLDEEAYLTGVDIYSSETGLWSHKESGWGENELMFYINDAGVFFNGMLHLLTSKFKLLAVDIEGKTWKVISLLETMCTKGVSFIPVAFIGHSQGRLYYINTRATNVSKLSVWILEDSNGNDWTLKYSISTSQLLGEPSQQNNLQPERDYDLVAIHPECSLIFIVWRYKNILVSYDMDRGKFCVLCSLKDRLSGVQMGPYLPYVPFYSRMSGPRVDA